MKRKYKTNLLAALLLALPIVLAGCGGKEERKVKHLEKGKAFYEQADFEKAKIEVKNVLQIDPKSAEAFYLSGMIAEKQKEWQKAFGNYAQAVELKPDYLKTLQKPRKMSMKF
jgi:Tfp pilus assembly protein PilF